MLCKYFMEVASLRCARLCLPLGQLGECCRIDRLKVKWFDAVGTSRNYALQRDGDSRNGSCVINQFHTSALDIKTELSQGLMEFRQEESLACFLATNHIRAAFLKHLLTVPGRQEHRLRIQCGFMDIIGYSKTIF